MESFFNSYRSGCNIYLIKAKRDEAKLLAPNTYSITVSTFKVEKQQVSLTLPYIAQTQNDMDVNLASKIAARVDYVKNSGVLLKKVKQLQSLMQTSIEANQKSIDHN